MSYTVIAPLNETPHAIYIGIREFPTNRLILICTNKMLSHAKKIKKDLLKFNIIIDIREINGPVWEEIFRIVSDIALHYPAHELMINIGAGDRTTRCAATSAAFVNGLKAFDVLGASTMVLPVLKFSYYKLLTDKKLLLLKILSQEKDQRMMFDALSKKAKMSPSLLSYHLNGTLKSDGLKQLGLVELFLGKRKQLAITLTTLGRLLIKGYIS